MASGRQWLGIGWTPWGGGGGLRGGGNLLQLQRDLDLVLVLQNAGKRGVEDVAALDPANQHQETAELPRPGDQVELSPGCARELVKDVPEEQGCIRREGASEAAPAAVRQAVGGGCQSGWGAGTVGYKYH